MLDIPDIPPSPAWQMAWDGYELHNRASGNSPKTIITRRSAILLLARWATDQGTEPEQVTREVLTGYLVRQYAGRSGSGPQIVHAHLVSFFKWLSAEYEMPNPMTGIPYPKGTARITPVLRPSDFRKVLAACKVKDKTMTLRDTAVVWLLIESGLRRSELAALDVADVDVKERTVVVRSGKGGKARVAAFGDDTARALWRWLRHYGRTGDAPLFPSAAGGRLRPIGVSQLIARVGSKAGIHLHPHQLRHTWTHYALADGMQEGDIMAVAGWSTRRMLARYGADLKQERAISAALAHPVGRLLREAGS